MSPLSSNSLYYNKDPSLDDRVHVLVCVLSANMIDIDDSYLKKMADIREAASNLGRRHLPTGVVGAEGPKPSCV